MEEIELTKTVYIKASEMEVGDCFEEGYGQYKNYYKVIKKTNKTLFYSELTKYKCLKTIIYDPPYNQNGEAYREYDSSIVDSKIKKMLFVSKRKNKIHEVECRKFEEDEIIVKHEWYPN